MILVPFIPAPVLSRIRCIAILGLFLPLAIPFLVANEPDFTGSSQKRAGDEAAQSDLAEGAAEGIVVHEVKTITPPEVEYAGWPMLIRTSSGKLMVVYSGGRDYHVGPFGRIEMMTSKDDGETWTWPQVILDTPLDDRGTAILETADGTLLVTFIASTVYKRHLNKPERHLKKVFGDNLEEHLHRWRLADARTTPEEIRVIEKDYGGRLLIRSTDGGLTWSETITVPCFSPRGPMNRADGTVLYVSGNGKIAGAWSSKDEGQTWEMISELPTRAGESHSVQAADGTIVAHVREKLATDKGKVQYTIQTESSDGGLTWSEAHKVADGYPSQLLKLNDDALLMTYGMRTKPYGIRGKISRDNGQSWSPEFVIYDEGASWDIGYPCSVQLPDDRIVTIWYEAPEGDYHAQLRQAVWSIDTAVAKADG